MPDSIRPPSGSAERPDAARIGSLRTLEKEAGDSAGEKKYNPACKHIQAFHGKARHAADNRGVSYGRQISELANSYCL